MSDLIKADALLDEALTLLTDSPLLSNSQKGNYQWAIGNLRGKLADDINLINELTSIISKGTHK